MTATAPALETIAGRYELLREIGRGGQARTFLARDRQTGAQVAVKRLLLAHAEDWKAVELFEREGQVLSRLSHPGIPRYVDALGETATPDEAHGFVLVQEYVEGDSLAAVLARGELMDEGRATAFLRAILPILTYLHGQHPPVVHRDLKPSNLIRRPDGTYALIDFGAIQSLLPSVTRSGSTIIGTTGYMAPEQFMGRALPATDLYGLGATVLHLLTGVHPADLPVERMALRYEDVLPRVSANFRRVLGRLLAPAVEDRFQSAAEALAALAAPAPAPRAKAPSPPPPRTRGVLAVAASGVVLVAGVVIALFAESPHVDVSAPSAPAAGASTRAANRPASLAPPALPFTTDLGRDGAGLVFKDRSSHLRVYQDKGWYSLRGSVTSLRADLVRELKGRVELLDGQGRLVTSKPVTLWPSYKPPLRVGDLASFGASVATEPSAKSARLVVTSVLSEPAPAELPEAQPFEPLWEVPRSEALDVTFRLRKDERKPWAHSDKVAIRIELEAINRGSRDIEILKLALRVRGADGRTLESKESYAVAASSAPPLAPGETALVSLLAIPNGAPAEVEVAVIELR